MPTKICTRCKKRKPLDSFGQRASASNGLNSWCKQCARKYKQNQKVQVKLESCMTTKEVPCMRCGKPVKFKILKTLGNDYDKHRFCASCRQLLLKGNGCSFAD